MREVIYVRWQDASEVEVSEPQDELLLGPCIRENLGWVLHDQPGRLSLVTEKVRWVDGTETEVVLNINPDSIVEKYDILRGRP